MKKIIVLVVVLLIVSVSLLACGSGTETKGDGEDGSFKINSSGDEVYGPELDPSVEYKKATVEDVFVDPELYDTHVVIEAKIENICPSGCWFFIGDDDGSKVTLYVSRNKNSFTIPMELVNRKARVYGKIIANNRGEMLEGHRVEMID